MLKIGRKLELRFVVPIFFSTFATTINNKSYEREEIRKSEENNIKDQKAKNIIHHINCWCHIFYRPRYPGA
jgi:hypothetical protein